MKLSKILEVIFPDKSDWTIADWTLWLAIVFAVGAIFIGIRYLTL